MRSVVYLLVVVNLAFLGWNIFQSQSARQAGHDLPPVPEAARPLVTLQEREQAATGEVTALEALTVEEPPGASVGLVCQSLGPFLALDTMQAVEKKLVAMELQPQQRESARQQPIGYWVYLPEMERAEAKRLAQKLDDHNDKEYFIGKDNVLSLGAFKDMSRARIRLKRVSKMGIEPRLETRYRTAAEYWLDFRAEPAAGKRLTALLVRNPDVWLQDGACY